MGMFEDTVKGTVMQIEIARFNSPRSIVVGMPQVVTLIKIMSEDNKKYLGYVLGDETNITTGSAIVCTLKKTWNAYWVYHTGNFTELKGATNTLGIGDTVYRKIGKFEMIDN